MARQTPKVKNGYLELAEEKRRVNLDSPDWPDWLEQAASFSYESDAGNFTVHRRERAGNIYWYAYRRRDGKLQTLYAGKASDLNPARLEEIARQFKDSPSPPPRSLTDTKLYLPQSRPGMLRRQRLLEKLDNGRSLKLILVIAPPGYGKTTLLAEWAAANHKQIAWLSLDEHDNDAARFNSYLAAALAPFAPSLAGTGPQDLSMGQREVAFARLLEATRSLVADTYLVLDDYHLIENGEVQEEIAALLNQLPPRLHLIISSRNEPGLPLGRLRAQGQLLELKPADLSFNPAEAEEFFSQSMHLNLTPEQAHQLWERNEGWAAGIQLAALSLQGRDGARILDFIRSFSGGQRYVLDYLAEEVLARQPEEVQRFLLETSFLERLNADLCERVTGQPNAQAMLERLVKANLFIVSLDDEGEWYRYHHLFAQFLQTRLKHNEPGLEAVLRGRAAEWYEQTGQINAAVFHYLAAREFEKAARLIEDNGRTILMRGEVTTLRRWLDSLPAGQVAANSTLNLFYCWSLTISGQVNEALERFKLIENTAPAGDVLAIRLLLALLQGDFDALQRFGAKAISELDDSNPFTRSVQALVTGLLQDMIGNPDEAGRAYQTSSQLSRKTGNLLVAQIATAQVGDMFYSQGLLHRAAETYQQALTMATSLTGETNEFLWTSMGNQGFAQVLYEWNDLAQAQQLLEEAIQLGQQYNNYMLIAPCYAQLAQIKLAAGDRQGALEAASLATESSHLFNIEWLGEFVDFFLARLYLHYKDEPVPAAWLKRYHIPPTGTANKSFVQIMEEMREVIRARLYLAEGKTTEAQELLETAEASAREGGRATRLLEIQTLQAAVLRQLGQERAALAKLIAALALGEKEGFIRTFADDYDLLGNLVEKASANLDPAYRKKLLAACGITLPEAAALGHLSALSERELEVLKLVAEGLTNEDIARELVVGVSTVKTHLLHIYGKLSARNRHRAVARAKELGWL